MQTSLPFSINSSLTDIPHILLYQRHIDPIAIGLGKQLTLSSLIEVVSGNKKFKKIRLFDHKGQEIFEEDLQYLRQSGKIYATTNGLGLDARCVLFEYTPLRVICKGGQATVLLVEHKKTQEQRILKFKREGQNDQYLYLAREAIILDHLKHRNIVKQFNHKLFPKRSEAVLELEYLQGGSLLDYVIENGPMTENMARQVFVQILDAISYCHQKNVIHRDLKMENIMIVKDLEIKIIDFGLAYLSGTGVPFQEALNVGTLLYAAPEIILSQLKTVNKSVDVWALGVMLYFMVFGEYPFYGESEKEILTNITKNYYMIPQHATKELSFLIQEIFNLDYEQRINLKQIRESNWVQGIVQCPPQLSIHISDLLTTSKQTHENTIRKGIRDLTIVKQPLLSRLKLEKLEPF